MTENFDSSSPDVVVGEDGWIFLVGGSNDVLKYYTDADYFGQETLAQWAALLELRHDKCRKIGAQYVHMAAPEKMTLYADLTKLELSHVDCTPSIALPMFLKQAGYANAWASWVDLVPYFRAQRARGHELYWRTDTHWNFIGAYSAYQMFCSFVNANANSDILSRGSDLSDVVLDLGSKVTPHISEPFSMKKVLRDAVRVRANELVLAKEQLGLEQDPGLHGGSEVGFRNYWSGRDPRRVLIFGDSFSEYRSHLLTGLIAETFSETRFVWSAQIDWDVVAEFKPDIVLTELAERFMRYVPSDEEYSLKKVVDDKMKAIESKIAGKTTS